MKKKNIFFPVLGCLSGVAGVVSGFVLSCSVKDTVSSLAKPALTADSPQNFDFYSYFFGSSQTASVDDTALMTAKLIELCGKGFGLLLIFIGLFTVCYFGFKIEKALTAPDFPPPFMPPEQAFPCGMTQENPAPDDGAYAPENYNAPEQDYIAPDEGVYPPEDGFSAPVSGAYPPESGNPQ